MYHSPMMSRRSRRYGSLAASAAMVALGLAGCVVQPPAPPGTAPTTSYGPPVTSPVSTAQRHDQADITFLRQAVQLRQQAVRIADLAFPRSNSAVAVLSHQIATETTPPLHDLLAPLHEWGAGTPGAASAPGLLPAGQISQLSRTREPAFDNRWTQDMNTTLTDSLRAADAELISGVDAATRSLATQWMTTLHSDQEKLAVISNERATGGSNT